MPVDPCTPAISHMRSCSRRVTRAAAFGLAAPTWSGCSDGARPAATSVAKLETPEGFQPYAVRDGRVWGVFRDELEVESVRAHGIVKP